MHSPSTEQGSKRDSLSFLFALLRSKETALLASILFVIVTTATCDPNHTYLRRPVTALQDNLRILAPLGMLALGAAVVIIAGGIDLSLGSMVAFGGTVCVCLMMILAPHKFDRSQQFVGPGVMTCAIGGTLLAGFLVGTLHAWMITSLRLPPFIVTLGSLVGLRSLSRAMSEYVKWTWRDDKSEVITFDDPFFGFLYENIWISGVALAILALLTWLVLTRTVLGRHIYALGGNEQAARLSGIRTEYIKWVAYGFSSMAAALAGVFYVANEQSLTPSSLANGHELSAIAAAVVGGCSLQGGIGTVQGTILGALFLRVVIDAVNRVIKANANLYEGMIVGVVVVMAVTFGQVRDILVSGRQLFAGALGLVAIPALSLLFGLICTLIMGVWIGIPAGTLSLLILALIKILESIRAKSTPP
ncbi:MAG: ABC transporter permease [Planctomycetales bacterium]|nr:ABC transporter permease [Planctomycetales bacterium]